MILLILFLTTVSPAEFLQEKLEADSIYDETIGEGLLIFIEYEDSTTSVEDDDHFFRIAIRENHTKGSFGDPNTSPVRDRFVVYNNGRIFWWS